MNIKTKPSWGDITVISAALLLSVLLFVIPLIPLSSSNKPVLKLTVQGEGVKTYALDRDCEFTVENNGITLDICIENGYAYVKNANCRDHICKNSGKINRPGQSIICAPAGVVLTVYSENNGGEADAVAG